MNKDESVEKFSEAIFLALKKYTNWIGRTIIVCWILFMAFYAWAGKLDRDDTDPPESRSGIALYKDNRTGCEYLGNQYGGMTRRLDKNGNHICKGDN